ncbi:hypothetical protein SALCHL_001837 [Streptomyces albus subsp. chlorinus]|uniref:hypothetical protein n=1 Tax=Streptomyces albus TaxID=1888 RepID=UPI0015713029|nr:hypothetical protein [Streptomyces albus]
MQQSETTEVREEGPCEKCAWYRSQIKDAANDPVPRADFEALFGAHLRHEHTLR